MHNNIDLTNSTYINLTVEKNKTLDKVFQAEIWTGNTYVGLFDFSPYTSALLTVKVKPNDMSNVLTFSTSDLSIDFTGLGQFTLFKNASAMNIRSGNYVYEMVLKNATETRGFLRGKFVIADQGYGEVSNDIDSNEPIRIKVRNDIAVTGSTGGGGVSPIVFAAYTADTKVILDGKVESSTFNSFTASTITGGTEGLTRIGNNLVLGGTITTPRTFASQGLNDVINFNNVNDFFGPGSEIYTDLVIGGNGARMSYDNITNNSFTQINVNNAVSLFAQDKTTSEGAGLEVDSENGIVITDSRSAGEAIKGIQYQDDYSSQFGARSLPDVAYVTGITNNLSTLVNNNSSSISTINSLYVTGGTSGIRKLSKRRLALGGGLTGTTSFTGASATVNWGTTTNRLSQFNVGFSSQLQFYSSASLYQSMTSTGFLVNTAASKSLQMDATVGNGVSFLDTPSSTNTSIRGLILQRGSTGTAAKGIGVGIGFSVQNNVGAQSHSGILSHRLTNVSSTALSSAWKFTGYDGGNGVSIVDIFEFAPSGSSFNTRGLIIGSTLIPQASSILELSHTGKTLTLSRIPTEGNISTPVNGMIYYNSTDNKFRARENGTWKDLIGGSTTGYTLQSNFVTYTGTTAPATYQGIVKQKTITGSTYTVTSADNNYIIYFTNTCIVTLPTGVTTLTTVTTVRASGAGTLTHTAGAGATLYTTNNAFTVELQKGAVTWTKRDATSWYGFGALGSIDAVTSAKFNTYTGTTAPATYQTKASIVTLTGTTLPATYQSKASIAVYTGTTVPNTYLTKSVFNTYTGSTGSVHPQPDLVFSESDHFIWGSTNLGSSGGGWAESASGTGSDIFTSGAGVDVTENADGVVEISCGTTSTGRCMLTRGTGGIIFGRGTEYRLSFRNGLATLSDGTDTYTVVFGFFDVATAGVDAVDGAYFRYTHGTNSGRYETVTSSNSVRTTNDSGVAAVAGQFEVFEIRVNGAGSSIGFYINGTLVQTHTTNIPTGNGRNTGLMYKIEKSAGTNARSLYSDWYAFSMNRSTAR